MRREKFQDRDCCWQLDADEVLSANFMDNPEWQSVLNSPSGTVLQIQRVNLTSEVHTYWTENDFPRGFMDDGTEYIGTDIHGP